MYASRGGVSPKHTLFIKSTIFPIQNAYWGGGGGNKIFDFVRTYYVNDPMYKIRPFINIAIMKTLYYALIYSHLVYAIQVWGSACDTHLKKITVLQKRAVRLMAYGDFSDVTGSLASSATIFAKLEILKLNDIFIFQIARFIHNCLSFLSFVIFITGSNLTMRFIITVQDQIIKFHSILRLLTAYLSQHQEQQIMG